MGLRILENVADDILPALFVILQPTGLARLRSCYVVALTLTYLDVTIELSSRPVHKLPVIFHPLYVRNPHEQVLDPRCSRKWPKSPMCYMVQCKNRVWFAPRQVVEIYGETEFAHQVEGVVFKPVRYVDSIPPMALKLLDKFLGFVVNQRLSLFKS